MKKVTVKMLFVALLALTYARAEATVVAAAPAVTTCSAKIIGGSCACEGTCTSGWFSCSCGS